MNRRRLAPLLLATLLLGAAVAPARAGGDKSFSNIAKHLEHSYRAKRQGTFGMIGLARFLVKVIRPAGVKNFKVVMFKQLDFSRFPGEAGFHEFMSQTVDPSWLPMARISQRRTRQWTYVYFKEEDKHAKFLVVAMQSKEAVLVQFKFDPVKLGEFMQDPRILGIRLAGQDDKNHANGQGDPPQPADAAPKPEQKPDKPEPKPNN